jgi:hypothetical protein
MPSLLFLDDFKGKDRKHNPRLYFKKTWYGVYNSEELQFNIEEEYPHVFTIHRDYYYNALNAYGDNNTFLVELRRWVERTCAGDLILDYKHMNYRWWWNREAKNEYQKEYTEVKHGYWYFYFEYESDLIIFKLKYSEAYSTIKKYHPDYGKDVLEQDKIYGKVT